MSNNFEAVRNISGDQAKAILLSLCTNPAIRAKVASYAKRLDQEESSKKRKPESTIAICVQCDQPFYEEDNDETSYVHHDGLLEVNYKAEIWEDIDDDGPIDSSENEEEVPEGFIWSCCGTVGTSAGCKKGLHQADPEKSRRSGHASESKPKNDE
ncbi:hypothetical protein THARTR1_05004 [Trichoderma harzianum]|uniref:C2H2-type domain-containing protein n=1 Tax=Trichoderma harzianum TaxID=5544 RepID=A0A2K0U9I8_TRIHA|nr:hypothetical protein THARTR1_05004 [Trichoderma harzianum]